MKMLKKLFLITTIAVIAVACNNDDETKAQNITEEEAAEQVASSITTDVVTTTSDVGILFNDANNGRVQSQSGRIQACGVQYDTSFVKNYAGQYVTYNLGVSYNYELVCEGMVPNQLDFSFNLQGDYDGIKLESEGVTTGDFIADVNLGESNYSVDGTMDRIYTLQQKEGEQNTFNSQSQITLTEILIDKETKIIKGGEATYSVSGTRVGGEEFSFTASVVFNGDGTATILIDGEEYIVDLSNGRIS